MKVENLKVYGLEESIRRAKFPMSVDLDKLNTDVTNGINHLGKAERGSGHDNFLNGIIVQFDLTCSNKMWTEMQRYHFVDFVSAQSTMHRITKFDLSKTYNHYTNGAIISIMQELQDDYSYYQKRLEKAKADEDEYGIMKYKQILDHLYYELLYSNPAGFELTAGMTTNYRQLKTIYAQRKDHRLQEWHDFCDVIKTLPHSEWITA